MTEMISVDKERWEELLAILFPGQDGAPGYDVVWETIMLAARTSREPHAVNLDYLRECAAALIRAGLPGGCDVPPSDLPGKIKTLGEMRAHAQHQAQTLAGDVAALTNRLDDELPTIFDTVLDELSDARAAAQVEIQAEDIHEVGIAAFRLALRLVTDHEFRDRDTSARPRRLDCGCDPDILGARSSAAGDVWTCSHGNRWRSDHRGAWRHETDAEFLADHPIRIPSAFGLASVPLTVNLWGVPVDADHPAVLYLAMHLGALKGCDGSLGCRHSLIAATLHEAAVDCRNRGVPAQSRSEDPSDEWIRRTAERLADLTEGHHLGSLAQLVRDAIERARVSIIDSRIPADG